MDAILQYKIEILELAEILYGEAVIGLDFLDKKDVLFLHAKLLADYKIKGFQCIGL